MRIVALIGGSAILIVAVLFLLAIANQRRFIYPAPRSTGLTSAPGFVAVALHTADGLVLEALYHPAQAKRTVVFFHGNGDSLRGGLMATAALAAAGYGVLLPEYRGYGGNPGHPTERGLYADAAAALAFLHVNGVTNDRIVAVGNSLGSGAATELATRERLAGLDVVSGFTSLPEAARDMLGLPVGALIFDRYDNVTKIAASAVPTAVLHGDADRVIHVEHGRRLALAAHTHLIEFANAGHALIYSADAGHAMVDWLDAL